MEYKNNNKNLPSYHVDYVGEQSAKFLEDMIEAGKEAGALKATDGKKRGEIEVEISGEKDVILNAMKAMTDRYRKEFGNNPAFWTALLSETWTRASDHVGTLEAELEKKQSEYRGSVRQTLAKIGLPIQARITPELKKSSLQAEFNLLAGQTLRNTLGIPDGKIVVRNGFPIQNPGETHIFYVDYIVGQIYGRLRHIQIHQADKESPSVGNDCREILNSYMSKLADNLPLRAVVLGSLKKLWERELEMTMAQQTTEAASRNYKGFYATATKIESTFVAEIDRWVERQNNNG